MGITITKELSRQRVGNALEALIGGNLTALEFAARLGIDPWEVPDFIDRVYNGKINGPGEIITLQSKI